MSRFIDADAIKLEKGFFEKVDNVPKFYEWLDKQPTVDAVPREWWNALRVEINDFKRGTEFDIGSDLWFATNHLINLMDAFEKGGMFYASSADGERREE